MSARGEVQDARASGAKPRPAGCVREGGRRPTATPCADDATMWRPQRRVRPRATAAGGRHDSPNDDSVTAGAGT